MTKDYRQLPPPNPTRRWKECPVIEKEKEALDLRLLFRVEMVVPLMVYQGEEIYESGNMPPHCTTQSRNNDVATPSLSMQ